MSDEEYVMDDQSRPDSPQSYQTGEGGSLPPSPGRRELSPLIEHRRAVSADARLERKRKVVADIFSPTSGVVNPEKDDESKGKLGPHKPFGTLTVPEAWDILATHERLWFPLPIAWRDIPELEGCAVFFNKYPTTFAVPRALPDVRLVHSFEPGISDQNLKGCVANIKRIGPKLLQTLRRTVAPEDIPISDTQCRVAVHEVPPQNPFPSHLLIIEQDPPIRGERVRTYIPIHDVVLLSYTTNIRLPKRLPHNPMQIGDKIEVTVPIARFGIANPYMFSKIVSFIYSANQTADHMAFFDDHMGYAGLPDNVRVEAANNLPRLLRIPFLKREDQEPWKPWAKQIEGRMAAQLAMTYSYERLINLMKDSNLQYENIIKVGLYDHVFEAGLLLCRRLLLSAMCLSVVRDHLV